MSVSEDKQEKGKLDIAKWFEFEYSLQGPYLYEIVGALKRDEFREDKETWLSEIYGFQAILTSFSKTFHLIFYRLRKRSKTSISL